MRTYHSLIDGAQVAGSDWVYVLSPDSLHDDVFSSLRLKRDLEAGRRAPRDLPDSVIGRVATADAETVESALRAAADAAPRWSAFPFDVRFDELSALLRERIVEHAEDIVEVLVMEGHPLALARWQVAGMLDVFGPETIGYCRTQMLQEYELGPRRLQVRRQPDGVVCVNPPRNAPLSSVILSAAALMAGNTLVVRAPRSAPLGVMYILHDIVADALAGVGAPPGTLNAVCGDPDPMLSAWLSSPCVDDIIYFGGSEQGMEFEARCVAAGKKPILELAGNDVVAVWKDADLELAAEALAESFYGSGQLCMIPNQVLVHPEVADALVETLVRTVASIRPGRPQDPDVLLSPVLRNDNFFDCLADAMDKGAELACGGHAMQIDGTRDPAGIFLEPTVVVVRGMDEAREIQAVRHETFFPLLPVVVAEPAGDDALLDRFIGYMNSNEYGLRNSFWGRDGQVIDQVVTRVRTGGLLKVNDSHMGFVPYLPTHGGTGLTGGVFGEANYPVLRTSHLQGVSISSGSRPKEVVFERYSLAVGESS